VLTTVPPIWILVNENEGCCFRGKSKSVSPIKYRSSKRLTKPFGRVTFCVWILSASFHGFVIMLIVMVCYSSFIYEDKLYDTSLDGQSTLVFSVVLLVVYFKLFLEMNEVRVLTWFLLFFTYGFYMLILYLLT